MKNGVKRLKQLFLYYPKSSLAVLVTVLILFEFVLTMDPLPERKVYVSEIVKERREKEAKERAQDKKLIEELSSQKTLTKSIQIKNKKLFKDQNENRDFVLGTELLKLGKTNKSLKYLARSLKNAPDHVPSYVNLALAYKMKKDYSKSKFLLLEVLKKDPKSAVALNNLAMIELAEENIVNARHFLQKSLRARYSSDTLLNLARVYENIEEYGAALQIYSNHLENMNEPTQLGLDLQRRMRELKILERVANE